MKIQKTRINKIESNLPDSLRNKTIIPAVIIKTNERKTIETMYCTWANCLLWFCWQWERFDRLRAVATAMVWSRARSDLCHHYPESLGTLYQPTSQTPMAEVKAGQIYTVGKHTIACGDSLNNLFVKVVIGDHKIRAVITDPPYGVAYVENKKGVAKLGVENPKNIEGDHLQSEYEYTQFTKKWIEAIIPFLDTHNTFHIFNSSTMFLALRTGMHMADVYFSQMLIWIKNQPVMSRKDYLPQHELIAYGWYGKHKFERSQGKDVIYHPRPSKSKLHPTQKPIGLLRKIIPNVTKIGAYVYDGFLGSGSTAIACEQLGRRCIGIEQDPAYVETCLTRLEKLTGEKRQLYNYHGNQ